MKNLNMYYKLYERFKTGRMVCWGANVARTLGIRHLLVRMDTNFMCNLRCKTCYFSSPGAEQSFIKPMKLDLFKAIAEDVFPKARILYLSCGAEPLMTKAFEQFLDVTARYSVPYVGYITNGLLLNEKVIRSSFENKVSEITISIDGATKATYEYIRPGGNFDKLMTNLAMYKEIASGSKGQGPSLRFNFTVTRSNHLEMPKLIDIAKDIGVSIVKFRIYTDWGGKLSFNEESLIGHEGSFNTSLREAKKRAAEANIHIIAPREFELSNNEKEAIGLNAVNHISYPPCIYPWFFRYIDARGKVRVCANLKLSEKELGHDFKLCDFEGSEEEVDRKTLLIKKPEESCFGKVCNGAYLRRANDDVNFLKLNS